MWKISLLNLNVIFVPNLCLELSLLRKSIIWEFFRLKKDIDVVNNALQLFDLFYL